MDARRLALWGDSLSAGVALSVATVDDRVTALAIQVPSLEAELPPSDADGSLSHAFKRTILSDITLSSQEVQEPMPVVSDDQNCQPSALKPQTTDAIPLVHGGGSLPRISWRGDAPDLPNNRPY